MTGDYLTQREAAWFAPILADIERAIAGGMRPNDAFWQEAGGLPAGDFTRLQLHWLELEKRGGRDAG